MKLTWVNHASYILDFAGVRLLADPWIFGSAFDDGWELLCESVFSVDDFKDITHIWFSHEHPDHFSPPVLLKIPAEVRSGITVLFQATKDRRVAKFCEKLGFRVLEMPNREPLQLAEGLTLACGAVRPIDSWLLVETPDLRILNLNDCIVENEAKALSVKRSVGKVDVLLTQFAYAQWVGNPDEISLREAAKAEKLERIRIQSEVFEPTWICPFASFVYFSHEENAYLNDGLATVEEAANFIEDSTAASALVLYPGDVWRPGNEWNNRPSLAKYRESYNSERTSGQPSPPVSFEELATLAKAYLEKARNHGAAGAIGWWERYLSKRTSRNPWVLRMFLNDMNVRCEFDWHRGLVLSEADENGADVELSSASLAYILKHDWGCGTIRVNGKYRATLSGRMIFTRFFPFGTLHSVGKAVNWSFVFQKNLARLSKKLFNRPLLETEEEPSFLGLWKSSVK
jgi:UDP-MurNAc hydroxylase